jgi:hypothetical protein
MELSYLIRVSSNIGNEMFSFLVCKGSLADEELSNEKAACLRWV